MPAEPTSLRFHARARLAFGWRGVELAMMQTFAGHSLGWVPGNH